MQVFTRYRIEVITKRAVDEDDQVEMLSTISESHVEEPLRACVKQINEDLKQAGLRSITVNMKAF